jgi:Rieske Fe-S protein
VIVATHLPVVPDGMFFSKAYPFSHPVVAAAIEPASAPDGMFINVGEPSRSFRVDRSSAGCHLIAVGATYETGVVEAERVSFHGLEDFLRQTFGIDRISHRWTNEDYQPMDGLPFVGRASSSSPHLYVAVGFNAWGISTGTAAATLIADQIMGRDSPGAVLLDATRAKPLKGGAQFVKENLRSARHLVGDRFLASRPKALSPRAGSAAVAKLERESVAAYRDQDQVLHAISAVCTHMGCIVGWNEADRTWDCPCHGSRFDVDGKVLHGPATAPLKDMSGKL